MATFVCIHGAGGRASSWDLVAAELRAAGHDVVAMDLPCDDDSAGLAEYTDAVVEAIGDRRDDLVLVAQSLGGFTAPLVADRIPVELIVLVTAMIPEPGETGGEWWGHVGCAEAIAAQGLPDDSDETLFPHDVPPRCWRRPSRRATRPARVDGGAVAARRLARRPHPLPALHGRSLLPARVDARHRPRPPRHRARRGARRPLRLPQPAGGPWPTPSSVLGRATDARAATPLRAGAGLDARR